MAGEAIITFIGNLTADPELKYTKNGNPVCGFGVANTPRSKNSAGEWENETTVFYNCTAWGAHAENIAGSLKKGQRVMVRGGVHDDSFTNSDGAPVKSLKILVDFVGPDLRFNTATVGPGAGRGTGAPAAPQRPAWGSAPAPAAAGPDAPPF